MGEERGCEVLDPLGGALAGVLCGQPRPGAIVHPHRTGQAQHRAPGTPGAELMRIPKLAGDGDGVVIALYLEIGADEQARMPPGRRGAEALLHTRSEEVLVRQRRQALRAVGGTELAEVVGEFPQGGALSEKGAV